MSENNQQEQAIEVAKEAEVLMPEAGAGESELVTRPLATITRTILSTYDPKPMCPPKVVDGFHEMSRFEKLAEAVRYCSAKTMYTISPGGGVQAFWKLLFLGVLIVFPACAVLYGAAIMSALIFYQVQLTTESLLVIARNLLLISICIVLTFAVFAMLFHLLKNFGGKGGGGK